MPDDRQRLIDELLFMQSGTMPTPNEQQVDMNDPFARAAYRTRTNQMPPLGRQEGNLGPQMLAAAMPMGGAVSLAGRAIAAAPKVAAGGLAAALLAGGTSQAGEDQFNWTDPDKERVRRIEHFPELISRLNKEMRAASRARMPSVEKQMDTARAEYEGLLAERAKDREAAFLSWQGDQQRALEAAEAKRQSETSLFDRVPGTRMAVPIAAGTLAYLGGRKLGKILPEGKAIAAGTGIGAAEGFASRFGPTELDAVGLPTSSPTQQSASNAFYDPAWWGGTALSTLAGGSIGGIGAFKGAMGRRDPLPRISAPAPTTIPTGMRPAAGPLPGSPMGVATNPGPGTMPGGPSPAPALPPSAPAASVRPQIDPNQGLVRDPANPSNLVRDPRLPENASAYRYNPEERERLIRLLAGQ